MAECGRQRREEKRLFRCNIPKSSSIVIVNNILTVRNGKGSGQFRAAAPLAWLRCGFRRGVPRAKWLGLFRIPPADLTELGFESTLMRKFREFFRPDPLNMLRIGKTARNRPVY